ncbi:hypothetical protein HDG35_005840 [Paraburkholderia sp. JPY681]|nr:hypothetical protein [Paraburkholderia atlantica]
MKTCATCKIEKATEEFYKRGDKTGRPRSICKLCTNARRVEKYAKNPSIELKKNREWEIANIDQRRTKAREWRGRNPDKVRAKHARRYSKDPEKEVQRARRYQINNREKVNALQAKVRAAKTKATPAWADRRKIGEFYFASNFLSMVTGDWYHVDHIVPLTSDLVCGLHCEENLRVIPASHNISKGNRHWPDMP